MERRHERLEKRWIDGIPVGQAAGRVGVDVELADRHHREIRRHRLDGVPVPGRPGAAGLLADQGPVRQCLESGWDGDVERERRLVAGVVVGREPARGDVRLANDDRTVVGVDEAGQAEFLERLGHAVITGDDGEGRPVRQTDLRLDRQLLALALGRRGSAVHGQGAKAQPDEVEVERRQVLRCVRLDRRDAGQLVGGRVVRDGQVVVLDVVAAIPVAREVRVTDPGAAGRELVRWRCERGRDAGRQQNDCRNERRKLPGHGSPPALPRVRVDGCADAPTPRRATRSP